MRKFYLTMAMVFCLASPVALAAGDGRNFGIQAPQDWTPSDPDDVQPDVAVNSWFTENGVTITEGVFIGPLLPGQLRDVDASVFRGTGRTICINATAERVGQPETRVAADPVCSTFPLFPIVPPTLLTP